MELDKLLGIIGHAVGGIGLVICFVAGLIKLGGGSYLFGHEILSLFVGGIALMVAGCLVILRGLRVQMKGLFKYLS